MSEKNNTKKQKFYLTMIQAYKYNGWLYHTWQPLYIVDKNKDYLFCAARSVYVLTSKKNSSTCFKHRQNSCFTCWFFFEKEWFNIKITINTFEKTITYYINLASPYLLECGVIKYIDFDLDFKCIKYINSKHFKWHQLDLKEFHENQEKYHYPNLILNIVNHAKARVEKLIKVNYFTNNFSYDILKKYLDTVNFNDLEPSNSFRE